MDSKSSIVSEFSGSGFYIAQFKTNELAIFSYYVESEGLVTLIDPTFDTNIYHEILCKRNATLTHVFLTHYHADFLSGHTQLKATVVMGKNSKRAVNQFELHEAEDGEFVHIGSIKFQVIHTPGHTLESSCFLLYNKDAVATAMFTGDTVFLGDVGRPDLAIASTITKYDLAGYLYDSIQKLKPYHDDIRVYPAHGAGSACGKAIGTGNFCTLGEQKKNNSGFTQSEKQEFVKAVTNISAPPKYFFYDSSINQKGPSDYLQHAKKVNVPFSIEQFKTLAEQHPVIDTRAELGKGLIKGAYWLPSNGAIINWLANLLTPETPFIIFCDEGKFEDIADRFLRIGYFNILGFNSFSINDWPEEVNSPKIVEFEEFKQLADIHHLDVRNPNEFESTGIAQNSITIPLPQLPARASELKDKQNLVISCRTGLRARVAYSILLKQGISSTIFIEHFDKFAENGIKVVPYAN